MLTDNLFATIITIIFIIESFWEFKLYSWLQDNQDKVADQNLSEQLIKTLRIESKWNWGSWILIIVLLLVPDAFVMPMGCLLVLFETLVIMKMDNLKRTITNK